VMGAKASLNLDAVPEARSYAQSALEHAGSDIILKTMALAALADIELTTDNWEVGRELLEQLHALDIEAGLTDFDDLWYEVLCVTLDAFTGKGSTARRRAAPLIPRLVEFGDPDLLVGLTEALVFALDNTAAALSARARGAMAVHRDRHDLPVDNYTGQKLADDERRQLEHVEPARWRAEVEAGRSLDLIDVLGQLARVADADR